MSPTDIFVVVTVLYLFAADHPWACFLYIVFVLSL